MEDQKTLFTEKINHKSISAGKKPVTANSLRLLLRLERNVTVRLLSAIDAFLFRLERNVQDDLDEEDGDRLWGRLLKIGWAPEWAAIQVISSLSRDPPDLVKAQRNWERLHQLSEARLPNPHSRATILMFRLRKDILTEAERRLLLTIDHAL